MQVLTFTFIASLVATLAMAQKTGECGFDDYQGQYYCLIDGVVSENSNVADCFEYSKTDYNNLSTTVIWMCNRIVR